MKTAVRMVALAICLVACRVCVPDHSRAVMAAEQACVAILEPEVLADLPQAERRAMAGSLDTLLTERLAKRPDVVLVDRLALDRVLTEKAGEVADLARIAPNAVASPLRPFWAAGVLICSQIHATANTVIVEAVSAQTGQVLAGIYATTKIASTEEVAKTIGPKIESFTRNIALSLARMRGKPLLEISGRLASGSSRLAWMVDDLAEAAGAKVAANDRIVLLVPRQPIVTKEERLLRVMGLAEARQGDAAAGLSPVPQIRLSFELADSAKTGVSFEKTPIRLTLSLRRGEEKPQEIQLEGEVGRWDACRDRATDWLIRQLAAVAAGNAAAAARDDEQRAKQLAEEELAAVAPWVGLSHHQQQELDLASRRRIARHVLRAAHLAPTSEPAAYLAACYVDALYPREGKDRWARSMVSIDRAMIETQRYLDRFRQESVEHHREMLSQLGGLGVAGAWKLARGPGQRDAILRTPEVAQYPYVNVYVRAWAEHGYLGNVDQRYRNSNSFAAFGFNLVNRLVPCIPDDKLDEEYEHWRTFYATKVAAIVRTHNFTDFHNTRPAPWDLVDAAFQARKRNPRGVRQAFQRLAGEFAPGQTVVWGGDQYTPARVPMFLQAAGDPEWKTWQPAWRQREVPVTYEDRLSLYHRFAPPPLAALDLTQIAALDGLTRLVFDDHVLQYGQQTFQCEYPRIQPIALLHGQVWLVAPGLWDTINCKKNHTLFAVGLDQIEVDKPSVAVKATRVDWPAHEDNGEWILISCHQSDPDGKTLWIGTESHGLAKFVHRERGWAGQWIGPRQGLPAGRISEMHWQSTGKSGTLQVRGLGPRQSIVENGIRRSRQQEWFCQVDLDHGTVRLLGAPRPYRPAARPPLRLTTSQGGKTRRWEMPLGQFCDADRWRIREIEPETGKPKPMVLDGRLNHGSNADFTNYASFHTPLDKLRMAVGLGEDLWLISRWTDSVFWALSRWQSSVGRGEGEILMIYRPAPEGDEDWPRHDRWIGPFLDRRSLFAMLPDANGRLWLTSGSGVYVTDWRHFLAQHRDKGFSTQQWRLTDQTRREQADWPIRVRQSLADGRSEQAMAIVDGQLKSLGAIDAAAPVAAKSQWTIAQLHKAMLLARDAAARPAAIDLYHQLATCPWVEPAGREQAWACHIDALADAQRWSEVVQAAERAATMFPRLMLDSPDTHSRRSTVERARQMLQKRATTQSPPATQPSNATPIR